MDVVTSEDSSGAGDIPTEEEDVLLRSQPESLGEHTRDRSTTLTRPLRDLLKALTNDQRKKAR